MGAHVKEDTKKCPNGLKRSWLSLKWYQYELNTGIYMLEPWERRLFNAILLFIILMSLFSAYHFMPSHIYAVMKLFQ